MYLTNHFMKIPNTIPRSKVKSVRKIMFNVYTLLLFTPIRNGAIKNTIEKSPNITQTVNRNSKNFVSISYCDGI